MNRSIAVTASELTPVERQFLMDLLLLDDTFEVYVKMTRHRCFVQGANVSDRNATISSSEKLSIFWRSVDAENIEG